MVGTLLCALQVLSSSQDTELRGPHFRDLCAWRTHCNGCMAPAVLNLQKSETHQHTLLRIPYRYALDTSHKSRREYVLGEGHKRCCDIIWPGTHSVVQAGGQGGHQRGNKTRFCLFALFLRSCYIAQTDHKLSSFPLPQSPKY